MPHKTPSFDDFLPAVSAALADWYRVDKEVPLLLKQSLLLRLKISETDEPLESVWRMVCNKVLLAAIERLAEVNPVGAKILRCRYADDLQVNEIVPELALDRHQIRRREKKAVQDLTRLLLEQEESLRQARLFQLLQGLSKAPSYDQLFGADETVAQLATELLAQDRSWLVVVTGMGGIGKTAVTDQTIRSLAANLYFEQILAEYLTTSDIQLEKLLRLLATQVGLPAQSGMTDDAVAEELSRIFKARPWLIWVDGFEADILHLAEGLSKLANPSKFILTSRHRPTGGPFFVKPLTALSSKAAADLLRDHARRTGRLEMAAAPDELIDTIYEKVGGNPLALKLVVGLSDKHAISTILRDLTEVKVEQQIEHMYRHIYWKAWQALGQEAQTVLKVMPMIPSSGKAELADIAGFCGYAGLDLRTVSAALDDLFERSLVEAHGSPWDGEKWYGIHSLTRTFLQTEIIAFPSDSL